MPLYIVSSSGEGEGRGGGSHKDCGKRHGGRGGCLCVGVWMGRDGNLFTTATTNFFVENIEEEKSNLNF